MQAFRLSAVLTMGLILSVSSARATQTIVVTDPTSDPRETWVQGNPNQSVSFSFTEGYSSAKIVMADDSTPTTEYSTINLGFNPGASPTTTSVPVPTTNAAAGSQIAVRITVTVYDIQGNPVASAQTVVNVYRPR